MVVEARRLPLETLADAAARIAATSDLRGALNAISSAAVEATGADLAILRILDADGTLVARVVAPEATALGAEIAGTRATADSVATGEVPEATRRAADRARALGVFVAPARVGGRVVGSVELVRIGSTFDADERSVADLLAALLALAVQTVGPDSVTAPAQNRSHWLDLAGEALAAGGDARRAAQQAVRVAVETTGARAGALWRLGADQTLDLVVSEGDLSGVVQPAAKLVREAVPAWQPVAVERDGGLPPELAAVVTLPLGQPRFAALQLFYPEDAVPADADLPALAAFAARATHALRAGDRSIQLELELGRTRSLLDVVGEAISQLSLAHTLETAVERIAELLQIDQLGVYLIENGRLFAAAGRGLAFGHEEVAEKLLALALGPLRARAAVFVDADGRDPTLAEARTALAAAQQPTVLAVPLHVREEPIGLFVAYPGSRTVGESDSALLEALAVQLAVAVQNARLHERAKQLGETLAAALASEQQSTRQLAALYEISRSFTQSPSLEKTLDAVTSTIVEVLDVDAAVIRVPDERGDEFVPKAVYVAESRLTEAVRTILERPQPYPPRMLEPVVLDIATARRLGGAHALLVPFLEKGSTAALLPITTQSELLAQLTIVSLDPAAPIDRETLATARTISQQAALALDNARLYDQQKQFAETMQQSLLPRERPVLSGLDVGTVYESAAQMAVGGDVFDFMELPDGRLAVVLGDVTGHGIDATADMAMAKFVFRSLAREHVDPSAFLERANEVVVGEIAVGKFITMVSVVVDPRGEVLCASAGHPEPRLVLPGGRVEPLRCGGLALGIDAPQTYEQVRAEVPPGAAVVIFTDGVVEARLGTELFGVERLDAVLAERHDRPAQEMAEAAISACRLFAGGNLTDDCAIVVIRRTS